uniref:Atg9 n=1 Tax=Arundo donax TaxID=35708 RepID=A0A0A9CMR8_ARUDO
MTYTNGKITRQGDRTSIAMPINTSRFFNTAGLVKNSFRTQNLLSNILWKMHQFKVHSRAFGSIR